MLCQPRHAAAAKDPGWPPKISEFVVRQQSDIMIPFANSPELKPGKLGPFFEMRTYVYPAGELPKIQHAWGHALPVRTAFGPVCAMWYSELGPLNTFIHIWPYQSLAQRDELRDKAFATGMWPPSVKDQKEGGPGYNLISQENKLMMPSSFSPLQ